MDCFGSSYNNIVSCVDCILLRSAHNYAGICASTIITSDSCVHVKVGQTIVGHIKVE